MGEFAQSNEPHATKPYFSQLAHGSGYQAINC